MLSAIEFRKLWLNIVQSANVPGCRKDMLGHCRAEPDGKLSTKRTLLYCIDLSCPPMRKFNRARHCATTIKSDFKSLSDKHEKPEGSDTILRNPLEKGGTRPQSYKLSSPEVSLDAGMKLLFAARA